jgi:phosphatidylinositol dimannoside acyltransferase
MQRFTENLEDLFVLFLIPALVAMLPWFLGFRVLRSLASIAWSPRYDDAAAAYASCVRWLPDQDRERWQRAWRLQRWVDRADIFLYFLRRDGYVRRRVTQTGAWPAADVAQGHLYITFHWGTGIWALRSASLAGKPSAFLSIALGEITDPRHPFATAYAKLRMHVTAKACGLPIIYTGGATDRMLATLQQKNNVAALVDLVVGADQASVPVTLFDRPAVLPRGTIRLAVENKVPVLVFRCHTDLDNGRRLLEITPSQVFATEAAMAEFLAAQLEAALRAKPSAWHFWTGIDRLMRASK